jgi:hypothetical protein
MKDWSHPIVSADGDERKKFFKKITKKQCVLVGTC